MRAGLPLAVLGSLLALVAGAALWLSREDGAAVGPVARSAPAPRTTSRPVAEVREPDARSAAVEVVGELPSTHAPTVDLVGTAAIAGRLLLDGGPPGEVVELSLNEGGDGGTGSWTRVRESSSAPDGRFRFDGLADEWSGVLQLPHHYRRAGVESDGPVARTVPARAGELALRIDVERLPTLRLRVLGGLDRAPMADAVVGLQADWDELLVFGEERTDATGKVRFPLEEGTLHELRVERRTEEGAILAGSWKGLELPAADPRGDIDLGDVVLQQVGTAWLIVLDPSGAPISDARAVVRGSTMREAFEADAQGRVELELHSAPQGFEVQARGYSIVELERPAAGSVLELRLELANRLTVEVVDPAGEPWSEAAVELSAISPPFEGGRWCPDAFFIGPENGLPQGGTSVRGVHCRFSAGADGRVEIQGLAVGLPFELCVQDALGAEDARTSCPSMAAGEVRGLRLVLGRAPRRVTGRCTGPDGQPIAGARVQVDGGIENETFVTDSLGLFATPGLFPRELHLRVSARGFTDLVLDSVVPPADLELRIDRGRDLVVELRDARGAAVAFGSLEVTCPGREGSWEPGQDVGDVRHFEGLPLEPLQIVHRWHARSHTAQIDALSGSFRLELPTPGSLEVHAPAIVSAMNEGAVLMLEALDDDRGLVERCRMPSEGPLEHTFTPWPGRYIVRRVVYVWTDTGNGLNELAGSRELGEPLEVEVRAGETTRVVLP